MIDVSDRYYTAEFMAGGPDAWALNRNDFPVLARVLHHAAGSYGLDENATEQQERDAIDVMAREHLDTFGIGPAYNYLGFPSGRAYFVGKVWTHRAHAKGRNPATRNNWNVDGVSVCAIGDYEQNVPGDGVLNAIGECMAAIGSQPLYKHGTLPTVNSIGIPFSQGTFCPGRHLAAYEQQPVPLIPNASMAFAALAAAPDQFTYEYEFSLYQHWVDPMHLGPNVAVQNARYLGFDPLTGRHRYAAPYVVLKHWEG